MKLTRKYSTKKVLAWLSMLSMMQLLVPYNAMSAPPGAPMTNSSRGTAISNPTGNLDLSSTSQTMTAGQLSNFNPTVINAGGQRQQITSTSGLTPAAALAVMQVLNSGQQTLNLTAAAAAASGAVALTHGTIGVLSNIVVPRGVSVYNYLDASNTLNLSGNLTNAGSFFVGGGSANASQLGVNAANIYNSGLISTIFAGSSSNMSLALNALHDIVNSGTITAGHNLDMTAGNSITNTTNAVLQAVNNVNLTSQSGKFVNNGSIAALQGNINFISQNLTGNMSLVGTGGTLEALNGAIAFRDHSYSGTGDLTLTGGNYLSKSLDLNSGSGFIRASLADVTGLVNVSAGDAHFSADTPNLQIGEWCLAADPFMTNTGNINIASIAPLAGSDYVIFAGGNITSSSNTFAITTNSATLNGGHVVLVAGAAFLGSQITGASATGGDILLNNLSPVSGTGINTTSTKLNGNGGDVTLVAYSNPTNTVGGHVLMNQTGIRTGGSGTGTNGNVIVIAQAKTTNLQSDTVSLQNIDTTGGARGSGSITLNTAGTSSGIVNVNAGTGALLSGTWLGGAAQQGVVTVGNLTTNGAAVAINAGSAALLPSSITTGAISTSSLTGSGGGVTLTSNLVGSPANSSISTGAISTFGTGVGAIGGSVRVSSGGSITPQSITTGNAGSSASGASAGNIFMTAGTSANPGAVIYTNLIAQGVNGGNVTVIASNNVAAGIGALLNTSSTTGQAGQVNLIAGANFTSTASTTTILGASAGGGDVSLTNPGTSVTASASGLNGRGGGVLIASYRAGATGGHVTLPGAIVTSGNGTGTSGDVSVVAGATGTAGTPLGLTLGSVNTSGGLSGTGSVTLVTAAPAGTVSISNTNGAVTSGTLLGGTAANAAIQLGTATTTGGAVSVTAGSNASAGTVALTVNAIDTSTTNGAGGAVLLKTGSTGVGAKQDISVTGAIKTTGGGVVSNVANSGGSIANTGGNVTLLSATNVTVQTINTGDSVSTANQANAGSVLIAASSASGTGGDINFQTVSATGVSGGNVQMFAGRNIASSVNGTIIDASASNTTQDLGNGGSITLLAGAHTTVSGANIAISGASGATGGDILFSSVNASNTALNTSTIAQHGSGGSIFMVAYANGVNGGHITIPGDINTSGSQREVDIFPVSSVNTALNFWSGLAGDVLAIAGAASTAGTPITIQLGDVTATTANAILGGGVTTGFVGGATGTGFVDIITAQPSSSVVMDNLGTVTAGTFFANPFNYKSGAVSTGNITTTGGNIKVLAGANASGSNAIQTGALNTSVTSGGSANRSGSGGFVTLMAGTTGAAVGENISTGLINTVGFNQATYTNFLVKQPGGLVSAIPSVSVPGAIYATTGGAVTILTPGNVTVGGQITTGSSTSATSGAIGGDVMIAAGSSLNAGNISFGGASTSGVDGGNVFVAAQGAGGSVTVTGNISTDAVTTTSSRLSGGVTLSARNSIDFSGTTIFTGRSSTGPGGDVILSAGGASGVTITGGTVTTTASTLGQIFIFYNGPGGASAPSLTAASAGIFSLPVQALPSGGSAATPYKLNFGLSAGVPTLNATDPSNAVIPVFFSPGGFTSVSSGTNIQLNGNGGRNMQFPVLVNGAGDITLSGSFVSASPVVLVGNNISVSGTFTTSSPNQVFSAVSNTGGAVTVSLSDNTALGSFATSSASGVVIDVSGGNLTLVGNVIAPFTQISTSQDGASTGNITNLGTIITNELRLAAVRTLAVPTTPAAITGQRILVNSTSTQNTPFWVMSGPNALILDGPGQTGLTAGTVNLANVGSIELANGANTTAPGNAALQLQSLPSAEGQGAIILNGTIDAPFGYIAFVAGGNILTNQNTTITATGNSGPNPIPTGGNNVYLVAGSNWTNNNNTLSISGRSGIGGDILLNTLSQFEVTTDQSSSGGSITLLAYANRDFAAGLTATSDGGHVSVPNGMSVLSPNGTGLSKGLGISIIGEAFGGFNKAVTISLGEIYSGVGNLSIGTQTPNISTLTTPKPLNINTSNGTISNSVVPFGGFVQPNASVFASSLRTLGTGANQAITVSAGGSVTTGLINAIGGAGNGPKNVQVSGGLDAYDGGTGANVFISGNYDVTINGNVFAFGGGGGGGSGDSNTGIQGDGGGKGGKGGNGGTIDIRSVLGSVYVFGNINNSGGGGGGGGGGFGGVATGSVGGTGGQGGIGGDVNVFAQSSLTGTVVVSGSVLSAAGGDGKAGGSGLSQPNGGSGGGGGGSFGGGGGGGGAGVSQPIGSSGFGGAAGGGYFDANFSAPGVSNAFGGAGGDVFQNTTSIVGFGGYGGGGYLNDYYGPGETPAAAAPTAPTNGFADGRGGTGGTYVLSIPNPSKVAAIGGSTGRGGQGGLSVNPDPLNLISQGGNGLDIYNTSNRDGKLQMGATNFTAPTNVYAATASFSTPFGSVGGVTIGGNYTVTGNFANSLPLGTQAFNVTTANGNIAVLPNTHIKLYKGNFFLNAGTSSPATSNISIGANASILGANNGSPRFTAAVGPVAATPTAGFAPLNVSPITTGQIPSPIFYGPAGLVASGPTNLVYALGNGTQVIFQAPVGRPSAITLGGGVQLGMQSGTMLSSLDLTNSSTVQAVVSAQNSKVVGGKLTTVTVAGVTTVTGGTLTVSPINLFDTLTALSIPTGVTVTFSNFSANNPLNVSTGFASTSKNVTINSPVTFSGTVTPNVFLNIVGPEVNPQLNIGTTGSFNTTGNLNINITGSMNISGGITTSGTLSLVTSGGTNGIITASGLINGMKGLSLLTDGSGVVNINKTLSSSLGNVSIVARDINFAPGVTGGKIQAFAGTVSLDTNSPSTNIVVGDLLPSAFTITTAELLAISAQTVNIGSLADIGGLTVTSSLNTTGGAVPATGVGFKNLSFMNGGNILANGVVFTLGGSKLTMTANGSVNPGTISGGGGVTITAGAGGIFLNAPITLLSGVLSISTINGGTIGLGNNTVKGGTATILNSSGPILSTGGQVQGTTVTLTAGAGGIAALTTNATNLSINTINGGSATVTATAPFMNLIASSLTGALTLVNPTNFATLNVTGPVIGTNITVTMSGANSGAITLQNSVTASGTVILAANGTGAISQFTPTPLLTANSLQLSSTSGGIGVGLPINTATSTLTVNTTGSAAVNDSLRVSLGASSVGLTFALIDTAQDLNPAVPAIVVAGPLSATSAITLRATNVTAGSVLLNNNVTVTPQFAANPTTVTMQATGSALGGGSVKATGGRTISAKTLNVTAGLGGISLAGANANTTANTLTANSTGNVIIESTSSTLNVGFTPSTGGATFEIDHFALGASTMTVSGAISAQNVIIKAGSVGQTGNLILNANVTGTTGVTLQTAGVGNVTGFGQVLGGGALSLQVGGNVGTSQFSRLTTNVTSTSGTVGSLFQANTGTLSLGNIAAGSGTVMISSTTGLATNANAITAGTVNLSTLGGNIQAITSGTTAMTVTAGGTGSASVVNTSPALTLTSSNSGTAFTLSTSGNLTVSGLGVQTRAPATATTGKITLTSGGDVVVGGNVMASGGGIDINSTDTVGGSISISDFKLVTTFSVGAGKQQPSRVNIWVGAGPIVQTPGSFPSGINTLILNLGQIFAGNPGIIQKTGAAPSNVQAFGSQTSFNSPLANSIIIGQGVTVKADPIEVGAMSGAMLSAPVLSATSVTASGVAPSVAVIEPKSAQTISLNPTGLSMPLVGTDVNSVRATSSIPGAIAESVRNHQDDVNSLIENVVLYDGTSMHNSKAPSSTNSNLEPIAYHAGVSQATSALGIEAKLSHATGDVSIDRGSMLLMPTRNVAVKTPFGSVDIAAKSIALVIVSGDSVSIFNFHDEHLGDVKAKVAGNMVTLAPGHHLMLTNNMSADYGKLNPVGFIGHRALSATNVAKDLRSYTSEFSIMSALRGLNVWTNLRSSDNRAHARAVNTILKDAAIIFHTRSSSGTYRQYHHQNEKVAFAE